MFDIGFWELAIIAVVGLIVIGPDKLPGVARTVGKWVGRTRRFVNQVKTDVDREIQQDELRKLLDKDASLNEIKQALNTEQYSFEEEKDYLVSAVDDAQAEHKAVTEKHADAEADDDSKELDDSKKLSEQDEIIKHERT